MLSRLFLIELLLGAYAAIHIGGQAQAQAHAERKPFRATVALRFPMKVPPRGQPWEFESVAGRSFALIPCVPREGVAGLTQIPVQKGGTVTWEVLAEACDGRRMSWFLVEDMEEEADVAKFLAEPDRWTWTQVSFTARANQMDIVGAALCKRGFPVWARGRVVGPDGKPVRDMQFKVMSFAEAQGNVLPVGHSSEESRNARNCVVGTDPKSGRIWVQCLEEMGNHRYVLEIQPRPGSTHGLAAVHNISLDPSQRLRIRVPREAVVVGRIVAPERRGNFKILARLKSADFQGVVLSRQIQSNFRIGRLAAGIYDLALTTASPDEVFYEQKGLVVTAGKTLQLHKPIDVRNLVHPVKISVVDREGNPVTAQVKPIFVRKNGWGGRGLSTRADGIFHGFVVEPGGLFSIQSEDHAPRLIRGIKRDTRVVLYKPHELLVEIRGLPESRESRKNLSLRAEPLEGFPDHAFKMLRVLDWVPVAPRKGPNGPANGIAGQYCSTKTEGDQPFLLRLTKPGKWKLSLVYHNIFDLKAIPLLDIVDIRKRKQKLCLTVSAKEVKAARLNFLQQTERRKGRH